VSSCASCGRDWRPSRTLVSWIVSLPPQECGVHCVRLADVLRESARCLRILVAHILPSSRSSVHVELARPASIARNLASIAGYADEPHALRDFFRIYILE